MEREASGHSSTWSTFFYQTVGASGLTSATQSRMYRAIVALGAGYPR
jgi:hypothetical protein